MAVEAYYKMDDLHPYELTGWVVFENKMVGLVNPYGWGKGCKMPVENIYVSKGNNRTLRVFVKTPELDIVDMTGQLGTLSVKKKMTDEVPVILKRTWVSEEGQVGSGDRGEMFFYLVPDDTLLLESGQYPYDVSVEVQGKKYTILTGLLEISSTVGNLA